MNIIQQIKYMNKDYNILHSEQEFIIHPAAVGILPVSKSALQCSFQSEFHIEDYQLFLDRIILYPGEAGEKLYEFQDYSVSYNGAVLIGANLVKEYILKGSKPACFSYQNVTELVFEEGNLITNVDQSKAMLRIRKNIDMNLRSLNRGRDVRCIKRFMNSAFVGDYSAFRLPITRMRYLQELKSEYDFKNLTSN